MTSLLVSLSMALAAPVPDDKRADTELQKKVDAAREKAVKFLKDKQGKDGDWESRTILSDLMKGGESAMAALALLEAGVPANDPVVAKAVEYLLTLKPDKTYVVSLQTQVLARTKDAKHLPRVQANADWLIKEMTLKGGKLQGWSYPGNAVGDNSNTHFAVMGLHAAAQGGAKVDADVWQKVRDYYADTQQADGGWVYHNAGDTKTTASMTANALLGLTVAAKYDKQAKGPYPAFEKGMPALLGGKLTEGKSVAVDWLTTAELGRALGATEFKTGKLTRAWYREGAEKLAKEQKEDGSWKAGEKNIDGNMPILSTACGLYFLGPPAKK